MNFNPENFVANLKYMATGMISIFLVIGVIILVTVILNELSSDRKK